MKKSYYNFIFQGTEGCSILYNARTGAMAELDEEHCGLLSHCTAEELEKSSPEFAEALMKNGFAVEDKISELDMIRYDSLRARYGSQSLGLTITPTQDCNFGCLYCYEKEVMQEKYMGQEIRDAVVEYVKKHAVEGEKLYITWYGGEPLMALEVIRDLTKRFLEICEEKDVDYRAEIVTNGYLLTREAARVLLECKVAKIQITLDGDKETHNKRRPFRDGGPTYQVIWENILGMREFRNDFQIALRVNVDKENAGALDAVRESIDSQGLSGFVFVYPGKVVAEDGCYYEGSCLSNKEFAELEQEFICQSMDRVAGSYPYPKHNICQADNDRALIIAADGSLYKCWMDIGREDRCVGNIATEEIHNEEILHHYLVHDATEQQECAKCKYLPVCMGGCPHDRMEKKEGCTSLKYTLKKYMEYFPKAM